MKPTSKLKTKQKQLVYIYLQSKNMSQHSLERHTPQNKTASEILQARDKRKPEIMNSPWPQSCVNI